MNKIAFLVDNWFGDLGGKKGVVLHLVNSLVKDYKIYLLTIDTKVQKEEIENHQENLDVKIEISPLFFKRNFVFYFKLIFLFGRKLKRTKPRLVICAGGGPHANAFLGFIAKIFLPKARLVFIDQSNPTPILKKQNFLVKKLTKFIYRKADKSISASAELSECIRKIFKLKKEQAIFVYNWLNPGIQKLMLESVKEKIFTAGPPIILTACRLDLYQKDFKTLLEAFKIVKSKKNSYLIIIGEGPDKDKIKQMVENLGLENDVFMLGYRQNPYKYMKNSTVFVLSTFHEAFGIVLIEAMACECPVVSSDCDFGPREIIKDGENGFLVPVGNKRILAKKIVDLLENENLQKKFIRNGQQILQKFTLEDMVRGYKRIIQEIL